MNLKPELLRGVYAYGFERPSAIQQSEYYLKTI
jgi:superfamily II DNA/RNA helicase